MLSPWGVWKAGKNRWRAICPLHPGAENNTQLSLSAWGDWRCFSCHAHGSDFESLLMAMHSLSYTQAKEWLDALPGALVRLGDVEPLPPYSERHGSLTGPEYLSEAVLGAFRGNCPAYLLERGFSMASLQRYEIGYDMHRCKIVLPIRDVRKRLIGLTYRVDFDGDRDQKAKYWHDHFDKSKHLYGFHHWADRAVDALWLVEGQLDAVRLSQLDVPAAAIMGSSVSREQIDLLLGRARCRRLVLAFDNDDAGQDATKKAVASFSRTRFGRSLGVARYGDKDPGEMTHRSRWTIEHWSRSIELPPSSPRNYFAC